MWEWSSPYPAWVYGLVISSLLFVIVVAWRTALTERLRRWFLFVPRLLVMGTLILILLNPVQRKEHRTPAQSPHVHFLVDASRSMGLEAPLSRTLQAQQAIQSVQERLADEILKPEIHLFRFGQELASAPDLSQLRPTDDRSELARALEQLPARFTREPPRAVVAFSDGTLDDARRLTEFAKSFASMRIPIHVYPVGRADIRGDVAIDELVVPPRIDIGAKAPVRGLVRSIGFAGERVVVQVKSAGRSDLPELASLPLTLGDSPLPFELIVEARPDYGELVVEIAPFPDEITTANNRIPFDLARQQRKLKVLYMEGTGGDEYRWVRDALQEDREIECVSLVADQQYVQRPRLVRVDDSYRSFPATREELLEYDCVICSDISIGAFTKEQLDWTVELVNERGGGFVMVGGMTSFGAGGWDQTVWDQLIPVDMRGGTIGQGYVFHQFQVTIPEEAQTHPIWKISEDPVRNRAILAAMPPFLGTNYMQRLKPAATTLGVSATPIPHAGVMPIFACQTYGRGRTFAFAPDTTADWGRLFESQWGEAGDNRYFRRFWRNTVRWLSENSIAGNKRLQTATDRVIYRIGQPIGISAVAYDEKLQPTRDYELVATLRTKVDGQTVTLGNPVPLAATTNSTTNRAAYEARMETLGLLSSAERSAEQLTSLSACEVEVVATQAGRELGRTVSKIVLVPDHHEYLDPRPRPQVLAELAKQSGGSVLHDPAQLASLLMQLPASQGEVLVSRQPLWDHPALWLGLVALLALEWVLRRLTM